MADKSIGELPVSQAMTDDALLVVYQNGDTQSIEGALVKKYARDAVGQYVDDAAKAAEEAQTAAGEAVEAAKTAVEYSGKPPKIEGGTWWIWDAVAGVYTDTGLVAQGNLLYATFDLDPRTGVLTMVTPEDYAGPRFILTEDGRLEVIANG